MSRPMVSLFDEISVEFENPAGDALGHDGIEGRFVCTPDEALLHWKLQDRAFRKSGATTIPLEYGDLESVTYEAPWWRAKRLILKVRKPEMLSAIPGAELGCLAMFVTKPSRENAAKIPEFVDFKLSEVYMAGSVRRLDATRGQEEMP